MLIRCRWLTWFLGFGRLTWLARLVPPCFPSGDFGERSGSQNRISNRFWSKNRSCRKQTIKPRLTGSRIACIDSLFFAQFLRFLRDLTLNGDSFPAALSTPRRLLATFLLIFVAAAIPLAAHPSPAQIANSVTDSPQQSTIPELFGSGEAALRAGNLDQAESSFKKVLAQDPNSAGAYANLGVIAMRRQNWPAALDLLHKAERLAPNVAGIRLNIGLVYYRQSEFHSAIAPFESVVRDQPTRCKRAIFSASAISSPSATPTQSARCRICGRRNRMT